MLLRCRNKRSGRGVGADALLLRWGFGISWFRVLDVGLLLTRKYT